jgi:hypothetical protein
LIILSSEIPLKSLVFLVIKEKSFMIAVAAIVASINFILEFLFISFAFSAISSSIGTITA